jgi:hypothetical protein
MRNPSGFRYVKREDEEENKNERPQHISKSRIYIHEAIFDGRTERHIKCHKAFVLSQ